MVYTTNPLADERWTLLVESHPDASVFHTAAWLRALQDTYGFEPTVLTTCPPESPLHNGLVLCGVKSRLTGRRLVSVPFADHCQPLIENGADRNDIMQAVISSTQGKWNYVELRPVSTGEWHGDFVTADEFRLHSIDLEGSIDAVFDRFHQSTIQRKIRRAEREQVSIESGRSKGLVDTFYRLMVATRRRHGVPPPPRAWFTNLLRSFGDRSEVSIAARNSVPIGAMLTLRHGEALVYKYGCSDARYHSSGAMPFLFWSAIQNAKNLGLRRLDLGRSDLINSGLIKFKDRLGASSSRLVYLRFPSRRSGVRIPLFARQWRKAVVSVMPDVALVAVGRILYKHIA